MITVNRVHQGRLDLGLDGFGLLHVHRKTVQKLLQNAGGLTRFHQIAVEAVEVKGIFSERSTQRRAGLDIGPDVVEQLGHAGIGIASPHNVKSLQQRNAGLHHGGQLAREDGNVLGLDALARGHAPFLDLFGHDALTPQGRQHLVFTHGTCFATNGFAVAVLPFPLENEVFDAFGCSGCHGVLGVVCLTLRHSLVTLSTSSSEVMPCLTLSRPDSRSVRTHSLVACWAMSSALPPRRMMR